MLTANDSATGAAVVDDVLAGEMFDDLASDVQNFISTFDAGYQPPSVPGSLSSGQYEPSSPTVSYTHLTLPTKRIV